jgi:hypothetical protein
MGTTLVTADEVRDLFGLAPEVTGLDSCVSAASRQLRGWVGKTTYTDALQGAQATDQDRAAQLKTAEGYLTIYHNLLNAGVRVRPSGVVSREQDAAGPMGGTVLNQYLSPKELQDLRKQYLEQATEMAAPYRLRTASPRAGAPRMRGEWRRPSWLTTEQGLVDHSIASLIGDDFSCDEDRDREWLEP